jgi:[acyl-carrier-protein] S-malonyltransferase
MKKYAVIFPGQGSQSVGMCKDLLSYKIVKETFAEATEVLGYDMERLVLNDDDKKLNQTLYTQPAMLCVDIAVYRLWMEKIKIKPDVLAGHSLGEYAAIVASEVIDFKDAILLVQKRAQYMQDAVPSDTGAMAAIIGLDDKTIIKKCKENTSENSIVEPVNFNSPGQVVIAGHKVAVEKTCFVLKTAGAKLARILPVSVPSHCSLMVDAAKKLQNDIKQIKFNQPQIKVIFNANASGEMEIENIKGLLVSQLHSPVLWVDVMDEINKKDYVIEAGPGKVLSNLNKRIDKTSITYPVYDQKTLQFTMEEIL